MLVKGSLLVSMVLCTGERVMKTIFAVISSIVTSNEEQFVRTLSYLLVLV